MEPPKQSTTLNVELPGQQRRRSTITPDLTETTSETSVYSEMNGIPFRGEYFDFTIMTRKSN